MKKFVVSMGLAAAGSAAFQMTCAAQLLSSDGAKLWNVSAALNGFYDDNYSTTPGKHGSYGLEFSPTISANVPLTQTEIGVLYTYDLQYYEQRDHIGVNPIDQSHAFNLWLDHSFNEQWQAKVSDSFVSGQEPELVGGGTPIRLQGNNIVNNGIIIVNTEWTRLLSTMLTYGNTFVDYDNEIYAGELNRIQNTVGLDLQWHIAPETMAFVGYQFGIVNYTQDGVIGTFSSTGLNYYSFARDNLSHYGYVGLQHNLLANLSMSGKVGIQYNDDYNDPLHQSTSLSPYVDVSLIYSYMPGCNAQVGFTQARNATDYSGVNQVNGSLTQDQESSTLHASINHQITSKLAVTAIGLWSAGTFNGGPNDTQTETDYGLGLSANYAFTRNLTGNINYNYDNLSSPVAGRGYERNRISIGVSVAY